MPTHAAEQHENMASRGFEPRSLDSESRVQPSHHEATQRPCRWRSPWAPLQSALRRRRSTLGERLKLTKLCKPPLRNASRPDPPRTRTWNLRRTHVYGVSDRERGVLRLSLPVAKRVILLEAESWQHPEVFPGGQQTCESEIRALKLQTRKRARTIPRGAAQTKCATAIASEFARIAPTGRQRAHGVVVSHPLRMRKALGSTPSVSTLWLLHTRARDASSMGMLRRRPSRCANSPLPRRSDVQRASAALQG